MASSARLGSRPSTSRIRSNSPSVSPSWRWSETAVSDTGRQDRLEQPPASGRAEEGVDGVLGVGHEADDVAGGVGDAGDVGQGAVGVVAGGVAEGDLARGGQGGRVGVDVAVLAVLDRDGQGRAGWAGGGPGGGGGVDHDLDLAADEAQA